MKLRVRIKERVERREKEGNRRRWREWNGGETERAGEREKDEGERESLSACSRNCCVCLITLAEMVDLKSEVW